MNKRYNDIREDEGFTLIELLIVIVILGILAAIVVFAIGKTRGDAVESACRTDFKSIELAAEAYKTKTGDYPSEAQLKDGSTTLLKTYPSSTDYSMAFDAGTITVSGSKVEGGDTADGCVPPTP
jgi:type II secretion system protein G